MSYNNEDVRNKYAKADVRSGDRKLDYRGRGGEQVLKPGNTKPGGGDRPNFGGDGKKPDLGKGPVFLLPNQVEAGSIDAKLGIHPVRRLYIIRNGRLDPEFKAVKASNLAIAGRSISTLIKTQGYRRSLSNVRVRPA